MYNFCSWMTRRSIRGLKASISVGLVDPTFLPLLSPAFKAFRQYNWIHQSEGRQKWAQKWELQGLVVYLRTHTEQAFSGWCRAEEHYQPHKGWQRCQETPDEWYKSVLSSTPLCADPSLCLPTASIPRLQGAERPRTSLVRFETGNKRKLYFLWAEAESSTGLPV